jgi:eukaryotic-like serine/threonine-protein kinase
MLTGEPPFKGATAFEVALQHVQGEAPKLQQVRPDLPADLCALVQRMMSKDPDQRPQTGREILRELNPARGPVDASPFAGSNAALPSSSTRMRGVGDMTSAPTEAVPPAKASGRRRVAVFVGLSIVLAMAAGVGLRLWANARTPAAVSAPQDDNPNLPIVSERERQLLSAVEMYAKPPADRPNFIQVGASHHAELGMLYLEQKRYDEAEKFFEDIVKRPGVPWQYKRVGNLGLAITYAMRDEPVRSVKQFLDMRESPTAKGAVKAMLPPAFPLPEDVINMRYWILTALERNATHDDLPLPLRNLRNQLKNNPSGQRGKGKGG